MQALEWYRASRCNYLYACFVDADGTFRVGPQGWDVTRTSTGVYVVRHGIGHTRYIPLLSPLGDSDYKVSANLADIGSDSLTAALSVSKQPTDFAFSLLVATTQ